MNVLHDVLGGALGTEVLRQDEGAGAGILLRSRNASRRRDLHQVYDLLDIGHETGRTRAR